MKSIALAMPLKIRKKLKNKTAHISLTYGIINM